jgi:hypothetical protein
VLGATLRDSVVIVVTVAAQPLIGLIRSLSAA